MPNRLTECTRQKTAKQYYTTLNIVQEAQLSQRDRATRYVS